MKKYIAILLSVLSIFVLSACTETDSKENVVYTTLYPQYDITKQLTEGTDVSVEYVLPRGVSAHTFEPSPSTLVSLLSGDLIIYTDGGLEPWVINMLEGEDFESSNVLKLSNYVTLLDHEEEHEEEDGVEHDHEYDPHFWSDPSNMVLITEAIEEELIKLYPDNETTIRENADSYIMEMEEVDEMYKDWEEHRTSDYLMHGGHNSIGYMVEAYNVMYVNPYEGFSTDAEPTAQAISNMLDLMNTHNIEYLFSEKLLSQTVANTISEETGATILYIYSMGNVGTEDYEDGITVYDMMIHNLEQYKIGLGYVTD